jgi:hypothetical protein
MAVLQRIERRRWALGCALAVVVVGMVVSLLWLPVFRHEYKWATPGDFWGTLRASHDVQWGAIGYLFAPDSGSRPVLTLPGLEILFVPLAWLSSLLGLSEGFPIVLPHPTSWLLFAPVILASSAVLLVAVDCLAERLGASRRRRRLVCLLTAAFAYPALGLWGHPEDVLALGLAIFALLAVDEGRVTRAGWLMSMALALKLDVVLVVVVLAFMVPRRRLAGFVGRAAALPVFLAVVCLGSNPHDTWYVLSNQPEPVHAQWGTSWLSLAHSLGGHVIAGATTRRFGVVAGVLVCAWLYRRARHHAVDLALGLWAVGLVLAVRCFFEAELYPYYFLPVLVVFLVLAAGRSRLVLVATAFSSVVLFALSQWQMRPWLHLTLAIALPVVLAALTYPRRAEVAAPTVMAEEAGGRELVPIATTDGLVLPTTDATSRVDRKSTPLAGQR